MSPQAENNRKPDDIPTGLQFGQLRAFLAHPEQGYSQDQITEAIGMAPGGRTWREIGIEQSAWLRSQNP